MMQKSSTCANISLKLQYWDLGIPLVSCYWIFCNKNNQFCVFLLIDAYFFARLSHSRPSTWAGLLHTLPKTCNILTQVTSGDPTLINLFLLNHRVIRNQARKIIIWAWHKQIWVSKVQGTKRKQKAKNHSIYIRTVISCLLLWSSLN